jgi:hypothetical protein
MNAAPTYLDLEQELARLAADEELVDPGGRVVARFDQCRTCEGFGYVFASCVPCARCNGEGVVRLPDPA